MKKSKAKTAAQKRKAKAKTKARVEEQKRGNWVEDRLDWVGCDDDVDDEDLADSPSPNNDDDDPQISENKVDGSDNKEVYTVHSEQRRHNISIISWNVLADAYCRRSSHKNLPSKFQSRVFNRNQRQHQIRQTLRLLDAKLSPDLFALQEVDPPLEGKRATNKLQHKTLASHCYIGKIGQNNQIICY